MKIVSKLNTCMVSQIHLVFYSLNAVTCPNTCTCLLSTDLKNVLVMFALTHVVIFLNTIKMSQIIATIF